ncbi:hypothetical protein FBZ33_1717 [Micromonospora sp. A202]|nr:hypothetical protein FBZ33_1717 [Micromonospora sp. A202]
MGTGDGSYDERVSTAGPLGEYLRARPELIRPPAR